MPDTGRICAIVDAYSSDKFLPEILAGHGVSCIHVQSTPEILPIFAPSFRPEAFRANIIHEGSIESTIERLSQHPVELIMMGTESGVETASMRSSTRLVTTDTTLHRAQTADGLELRLQQAPGPGGRDGRIRLCYNITDVPCEPKPLTRPRPTIFQGGMSSAAREMAARVSDVMFVNGGSVESIAEIIRDVS